MTRRLLVISAVNFREGGPLTVLRETVAAAVAVLGAGWRVIVLVNGRDIVGVSGAEYVEFPWPAKGWVRRIWFEYVYCSWLSRRMEVDLWLSLHDISPFVKAKRTAVYCHNPAPFYRVGWREAWLDPSFALFCLGYKWLYRCNINSNEFVIVQQTWLRERFRQWCHGPSIIVAHPATMSVSRSTVKCERPCVFLYPAFPRVFKNFELIGAALQVLEAKGVVGFEVRITISGRENAYAKRVFQRYGHLRALRFIGRVPHEGMAKQYEESHVLLFVSKLETWGLPITEAKARGLGIIASDLPYAHESVGAYKRVAFCPCDDSARLVDLMVGEISGASLLCSSSAQAPSEPFVEGWNGLMNMITTPRTELQGGGGR